MTPQPCDILIESATVLTVDTDDTVIADGAVAITGADIVAVGDTARLREAYAPRERIDAKGGVVHPGFIDAHIHISQYTSRSVLQRMEAASVTMGNWKSALRPEDEYASAALATLDYFRAGYTGFVDPGTIFMPDAVAQVADDFGIRIWLTDPYVSDRARALAENQPELVSPSFLKLWPRDLEEALERLGRELRRNAEPGGLVHAFVGIYGADTASPELFRAALDLARRNGVQFQEHRGYSPNAYRAGEAAGETIAALQEAGALGPGTTFVHMNLVHHGDIERLAGSGTGIVWCPYSQMRMIGSEKGRPRMLDLARGGAPVGLATDIPRSVRFDALGTLAHANAAVCGTPATPAEIMRMRTAGAAASVGAGGWTGSIAPGKRADIVLRAPDASEALGLDPVWETAILGSATPPRAVFVNGRCVARDGLPERQEPGAVIERAHASASGLMRRCGLSN